MSDIVFEYTPSSLYSHQGSGPSTEEGYNIWVRSGNEMSFLGFCYLHELEKYMKIYQDQDSRVFIQSRPFNEI
jgi:hypothetical protein